MWCGSLFPLFLVTLIACVTHAKLATECDEWDTKFYRLQWKASKSSKCRRKHGSSSTSCCRLYAHLDTVINFFVAQPPYGLGCTNLRDGKKKISMFARFYVRNCKKYALSFSPCCGREPPCNAPCSPSITGTDTVNANDSKKKHGHVDKGGCCVTHGNSGSKNDNKTGGKITTIPSNTDTSRDGTKNGENGNDVVSPIPSDVDASGNKTGAPQSGDNSSRDSNTGSTDKNANDTGGEEKEPSDNSGDSTKQTDTSGTEVINGNKPGVNENDTNDIDSINNEGNNGSNSTNATAPLTDADGNPIDPSSVDPSVCFHGSAKVQLRNGQMREMKKLRVGDEVMVGGMRHSTVYMFTHASHELAQFVNLTTTNGRSLVVTPGHLVHTPHGLVRAADLRRGDLLRGEQLLHGFTIESVHRFMDYGVYNPHTLDGNIVVDGLLASTYTTTVPINAAHPALVVFRSMWRTCRWYTNVFRCGVPSRWSQVFRNGACGTI